MSYKPLLGHSPRLTFEFMNLANYLAGLNNDPPDEGGVVFPADVGDSVPTPTTDGYVLTVDSTATDDMDWLPASGGSGGSSVGHPSDYGERTGGSVTVTESTMTLVHADFDLSVEAVAGDVLLFSMNGQWDDQNEQSSLDGFLTTSSDFISTGTGTAATRGVPGWAGAAAIKTAIGGSWQYVVQAEDISAGVVAVRLYGSTVSANDKVLTASTASPARFSVVNLGQATSSLTTAALPTDLAERTAGDITVTESTLGLLHADFDLSVAASEGDVLMFMGNALWNLNAPAGVLDVFLTNSSRFVSTGTTTAAANGLAGWYAGASHYAGVGVPVLYVVQATDVSAGAVAARIYAKTSDANDKTFFASTTNVAQFSVVNLSRALVPSSTAWTAYTPTWTSDATAPAIGDGTIKGAYRVDGKTLFFRITVVFGSTSTFGTGNYLFSLPPGVVAKTSSSIRQVVSGWLYDQSTVNVNLAAGYIGSGATSFLLISDSANFVGQTTPWTWDNPDEIQINGVIEID